MASLSQETDGMIRVVVADDHTIMREGLKRILHGAEDIEVIGEAVDGFETLALVRRGGFDLLLMDLSMPLILFGKSKTKRQNCLCWF